MRQSLKLTRLFFEKKLFYVFEFMLLVESENMDLSEAIKGRRSIRAYKKLDLPQDTIEKLLEAARWAPSAGNVQPWAFVVASSPQTKRSLSLAAYGQEDLEEASVVIVVCADEKLAEQSYGARGKTLYCLQDTAAAIQNILLTAYSLGLGSCWIGAFKEEEARKVINAPREMRPVALIPIGYPDEAPPPRNRRPLSKIMHKETFDSRKTTLF
jgi:nitroreductase